jgi:hypothetical protein
MTDTFDPLVPAGVRSETRGETEQPTYGAYDMPRPLRADHGPRTTGAGCP